MPAMLLAAGGTLCAREVSKPFVGSSLRQIRQARRVKPIGLKTESYLGFANRLLSLRV
jgi:hypothetical protein